MLNTQGGKFVQLINVLDIAVYFGEGMIFVIAIQIQF